MAFKPAATSSLGTINLIVGATSTEAAGAQTGATSASTSATQAVTVHATTVASPIVLDLNGDGIKTLGLAQVRSLFDLLNTGTLVSSGCLSSEHGFLAWDKNGNGRNLRDASNLWFYEPDQDFQGKDQFVISVKRGSRYVDFLLDMRLVTHLTTSPSVISMDSRSAKRGERSDMELRRKCARGSSLPSH